MASQPSVSAQLAIALEKNRELTRKLYTIRNEAPPDDAGCAAPHSRTASPSPHAPQKFPEGAGGPQWSHRTRPCTFV